MAHSSPPKPNQQIKRLGELLQEQQEPFQLDVYLLERGYSTNSSFHGNSGQDLKRIYRRKETQKNPKNILKSLLNKLTFVHGNQKSSSNFNTRTKNGDENNCNTSTSKMINGKTHQVEDFNRFSSASSSMTLFDSCSESDNEEFSQTYQENPTSSSYTNTNNTYQSLELHNFIEQPSTSKTINPWGSIEDSKQHSPVSILEQLPFDEVLQSRSRTSKKKIKSDSSFILPKKLITDESIFSASLMELLVQPLIEKQGFVEELVGFPTTSSSSTQYLKNKRVLEQKKQLLFDCVRETIENSNHGRKLGFRMSDNVHEMLGGEDLGKIICEKICLWGKQSGNITQIINSDFCLSTEEWSETQIEVKAIGVEIGDSIFDDIKNEIVIDMIDDIF